MKLHSTYQAGHFYGDFSELPKALQKALYNEGVLDYEDCFRENAFHAFRRLERVEIDGFDYELTLTVGYVQGQAYEEIAEDADQAQLALDLDGCFEPEYQDVRLEVLED